MKIFADMHTHTIASTHAYSTILENAKSACEAGIKALAMTDHAPNGGDSPHIWHFYNLGVLPREICGVTIIRGIEANIIDLYGELGLDDEILNTVEWVVASVHPNVFKPKNYDDATKMYLNLAKNKDVDCLGHSTAFVDEFDYEKVVKAFKENDKIIELNESSIQRRAGDYEKSYEMIKLCKKFDVKICVNSDSHYCDYVGKFPLSLKLLKEVDFPQNLIINADFDVLKEYILKKRPCAFK